MIKHVERVFHMTSRMNEMEFLPEGRWSNRPARASATERETLLFF